MKKILSLILLVLLPVVLMADPVDKDAARLKAEAFFMQKNPSSARRAQVRQDIRLALTNESFHVFNLGEDGGFVMIAGDDCAPDILGYSYNGTFDAENMPENLREWLDGYAEQIAWMKENGGSSRSAANSWGQKPAIEPFLTSKWGQGDPYNRQTPKKDGQHCVTGCVATAMAQVMYYWYKKTGYETRLCNPIVLATGNLNPTTFDWAHMWDDYSVGYSTDTEKDAVAKLMKYCGYSVGMKYGIKESTTNQDYARQALAENFGFRSARVVHRRAVSTQYTYQDWMEIIYTDLAAGRPVMVSGRSGEDDGHSFVCDGYDKEDFFHFNWGWRGSEDGYYRLWLCNTEKYTFTQRQKLVCCIHPTQSIPLTVSPSNLFTTSLEDMLITITDVNIPTFYAGEEAEITMTVNNVAPLFGLNTVYSGIISANLNTFLNWFTGMEQVYLEPGRSKRITVTVNIPSVFKSNKYFPTQLLISYGNNLHSKKFCQEDVTIYRRVKLSGEVQIRETVAEPGEALTLKLTGDANNTDVSKRHKQWQVSPDGKKDWTDIPDATGTQYYPTMDQVDKYLRVVFKVDDLGGKLVSDSRKVIKPTLKGTVTIGRNNAPHPGATLYCHLEGKAADIDPSLINIEWLFWDNSSDAFIGRFSYGNSYTLKESDMDRDCRLIVYADGYEGRLYSEFITCCKDECKQEVVTPTLSTAYSNQVTVTNPQATQEYIIVDYKKDISMLTESDWKDAKTPAEGETYLNMGGKTGKTNYVYTRVKETRTASAGTEVRRAAIYLGNGVEVDAIELSIYKGWSSAELQQDDLGAYYLDSGGSDFYRITVTPHPENADFQGIRGSKWWVKGYSRASQWGRYFSDRECTQIIDADTYYKTVYFKPQDYMPINYMELRVEHTRGYNDIVTDAILVNVASNSGMYKIEQLYIDNVTVNKGKRKEGEFATRPHKAVPKNMSAMKTDGEGTPPVFTFDIWNKTFVVDATDATTGTYQFAIYANGAALNSIKVEVTAPAPEEIRILPDEFTLDCGEPLQLEAQLFPEGAEGEVTWSSSNTSVATVTSDGLVTFKDGADIGATAIITATVGELSASCELTVAGEEYPIYIAGKQVTTRNMDDLAAVVDEVNGASGRRKTSATDVPMMYFDGEVLWLKNITINTGNSGIPGIVIDQPGVKVIIEGDCGISSYSGIGLKIAKDTKIYGDGTLSITSNDAAIMLESEEGDKHINLEVNDIELSLFATNLAIKGSENDRCSVTLNNVTGWWQGNTGIVAGLQGGLEMNSCHFVEPEGLEMISGSVFDGEALATYAALDHVTTLYEEFDNTPLIEEMYDEVDFAALGHYRLSHDCKWQTLCLPFNVYSFAGTPFEDATVMTLDTEGKNGFDEETGTLYLTFKSVTTTEAGKPYIVGFTSGDDCYQPILRAYFRSKAPQSVSAASEGLAEVKMVGTFTPVSFEEDYSGTFFIDGANDLYAATEWSYLNSFRAYFDVPSLHNTGQTVKRIDIDFADAPDGIGESYGNYGSNGDCFDLSGRKLDKPLKGINIIRYSDGTIRKVLIKE
ncbi:MAG: C10 family peptidase [Bacteroidaceae bacterium]|nr:C10 family peptidase [Bacteroidaceae bacterium]